MSSPNNDATKLAATALLSAGLGALISYSYYSFSKQSDRQQTSSAVPSTRTSFIFHDPSAEPSQITSSDATVLFPHSHEERMRRRIAARMTIEEENSQPRQSVTVRVPVS